MEARRVNANPVKVLYGSAILLGAILGLGCSAVRAWPPSRKSVQGPALRQAQPARALLNQSDRDGLHKILDRQIARLRERAALR